MQQIKDLVATDISRGLFERIQRGIALQPYKDLYISAQGDDATADGTQNKPFKTIPKLLEHINVLYANNATTKNITIKFLADFTHTKRLDLFYNTRWYLIFDAESHNVTLGAISTRRCNVRFNGITFSAQNDLVYGSIIDADNSSLLIIDSCKFTAPSVRATFMLCVRYHSTLLLKGENTVNLGSNNNSIRDALIACYAKSDMYHEGSLSIKSNITTNKIISLVRHGSMYLGDNATFKANTFTVTAKKYFVKNYSFLDLRGKGDSVLIGNQAGELLDGKIY